MRAPLYTGQFTRSQGVHKREVPLYNSTVDLPLCNSLASHLATVRAKLQSWILSSRGATSAKVGEGVGGWVLGNEPWDWFTTLVMAEKKKSLGGS